MKSGQQTRTEPVHRALHRTTSKTCSTFLRLRAQTRRAARLPALAILMRHIKGGVHKRVVWLTELHLSCGRSSDRSVRRYTRRSESSCPLLERNIRVSHEGLLSCHLAIGRTKLVARGFIRLVFQLLDTSSDGRLNGACVSPLRVEIEDESGRGR